jgi:protein-L-isoaspartate O-methyltransferase
MTVLSNGRAAVVDLGCGTGRHAVLLAEHFQRVVAVDVSGSLVDLAENFVRVPTSITASLKRDGVVLRQTPALGATTARQRRDTSDPRAARTRPT